MICRLCLINISTDSSRVSLFSDNNSDSLVVKIIAKYLHFLLAQNDTISTTICQKCNDHLDAFHKFSTYVEDQQFTLRTEACKVNNDKAASLQITDVVGGCSVQSGHSNECTLERTSPLLVEESVVKAEPKYEPEESDSILLEPLTLVNMDRRFSQECMNAEYYNPETIEVAPDNNACENSQSDSPMPTQSGSAKKQRTSSLSSFLSANKPTTYDNVYIPTSDSAQFFSANSFTNILFTKIFYRVIKPLENTEFQQRRGGALVQCCFCECKLRGSIQVTSNLIRHLKLKHHEAYEKYKRLKAVNTKKKLKIRKLAAKKKKQKKQKKLNKLN